MPHRHLARFCTVIIQIQTMKDVTAGVIWHCAQTVELRFNRYCDLYQSNDLVTGKTGILKGETWSHIYSCSFILIMIISVIRLFQQFGVIVDILQNIIY